MFPVISRLYRNARARAARLRALHSEFRTAHFMYSLPEDIRKDIGWPDFENSRIDHGRRRGS